MPGAQCTRSLVCAWGNKYAHEYSQRVTGITRHSRTQWFYGLFRDLPGDRLSCHRRLAEDGASRPVGRERLRKT
jgi:hypothetical protein